jgi:hypothetical protein
VYANVHPHHTQDKKEKEHDDRYDTMAKEGGRDEDKKKSNKDKKDKTKESSGDDSSKAYIKEALTGGKKEEGQRRYPNLR